MSIELLNHVMHHSKSRLGDRLVLIVLADHANRETGVAFPSVARIVRFTNLSESQVHRCIKNLEAAGEITITPRPGTSNIYRVTGVSN